MKSTAHCSRWLAAGLAVIGFSLSAGDFVVPAEGPVPFRRDKIPLDAEAMADLSDLLVKLARDSNPKTAAQRRGVAQSLALSIALDPGNKQSRDILLEYKEGRHESNTAADKLENVLVEIRRVVSWLEKREAGPVGNALADCLKDIDRISDTGRSVADDVSEGSDLGAWSGWIPAITEYESKNPSENSVPTIPNADPAKGLVLNKAEVQTLLWRNVGKIDAPRWELAKAPIRMIVEESGVNEDGRPFPFSILIGSGESGASFDRLGESLVKILVASGNKPPPGFQIHITSPELESSIQSQKRQSISAASAVLAASAFTGVEPGAIILGLVDETGAFKVPSGFWDQLRSLGPGTGQRLVLPLAGADDLSAFLALEKPGFFLEYEVMLAADFKQLTKLAAATPEGTLLSASKKFHEVQLKLGNQDPRQYVANRFVRQRLAEIYQESPSHFSAKLLLIQASGNRPTLVSRKVLAAEILRAIEPLDWVLNQASSVINWDLDNENFNSQRFSSADIDKFNELYEFCRTRLDALERYAEKADLELLERARKTNLAVRTLYRASRTRGDYFAVASAVRSACHDLERSGKAIKNDLAVEAGISKPASR